MRRSRQPNSLLIACGFLSILLPPGPASAGELNLQLRPELGTAAPTDFESVVSIDGSGLPPGGGTAQHGEALYAKHCAACHGMTGRGPGIALAGGLGTLETQRPVKTVGSYWPYATTLFDYIRRAMPYGAEKSLGADEIYSITAYVLHLSDIVGLDTPVTQGTLADIEMPNRDGFVPAANFSGEHRQVAPGS